MPVNSLNNSNNLKQNNTTSNKEFLAKKVQNAVTTINSNIPLSINGNQQLASYATSGNGSNNNPYIIENYIIKNTTNILVQIANTSDYFILKNFTVSFTGIQFNFEPTASIYLYNVTNAIIENSTISNSYFGIESLFSSSILFRNNTISNVKIGIYFQSSKFNSIFKNFLFNDSIDINLFNSQNNNISQNTIQNLFYQTVNEVNTNTIYTNQGPVSTDLECIYSNQSNYNVISNNYLTSIGLSIILSNSNSSIILSNQIVSVPQPNPLSMYYQGIFITNSLNSTIKNNSLIAGGMFFYGQNLNRVEQYSVTNNTLNHLPIIFLENKYNISISQQVNQVILVNCSFSTESDQIITNSNNGIQLLFTHNNILRNISIINSIVSFYLFNSYSNLFQYDSALNFTNSGFGLGNSTNNSIINSQSIGTNKTFITNVGAKGNFNTYGFNLQHSNNNIINNCTSKDNQNGIWLSFSNNQIIEKSLFSKNTYYAISIYESNNTKFISNLIDSSNIGITSSDSNNNSYINNTVKLSLFNGISLYFCKNDIITNNTISSNKNYGIDLKTVQNTNVTWNEIYNNTQYGIYLSNCSNNFIYLNSFISNGAIFSQGYSDTNTNHFSNGTYGNYWSNYKELGSSSSLVGTTSYQISGAGNLVDPYPLLEPAWDLLNTNFTSHSNNLFNINLTGFSSLLLILMAGSIVIVIAILSWAYVDYRKLKKSNTNKSFSNFKTFLINKLHRPHNKDQIPNEISDETFKELEEIIDENK